MNRYASRLVMFACLGLLTFATTFGHASAQEPQSQSQPGTALTEADRDILAWWDTLGFPDLINAPFMQVQAGALGTPPDARPYFLYGFLDDEDDEALHLFTTDLMLERISRDRGSRFAESGYPYVPPRRVELLEFIRERLRLVWAPDPDEEFPEDELEALPDVASPRLSEQAGMVLYATVLAQRGEDQLAHDMLSAARVWSRWEGESLREHLVEAIATAKMWDAILAVDDIEQSLSALQTRFRFVAESLPTSSLAPRASELAEVLQRMIAEDEAHAADALPPPAERTTEQQVAELIYQLRTQNGFQMFQPGLPDILLDPREAESPADQLVALGLDAVPALIALLDDTRITRTIGYWRDFTFSHYIYRYADAAEAILSRIAGRGFYRRMAPGPLTSRPGHIPVVREEAQAWYERVQEIGLTEVWAEVVERGDVNSLSQAALLAQRDPARFMEAMPVGMAATQFQDVQDGLVRLLGEIDSEEATTQLRSYATDEWPIRTRVIALIELNLRVAPDLSSPYHSLWIDIYNEAREGNGRTLVGSILGAFAFNTMCIGDHLIVNCFITIYSALPLVDRLFMILGVSGLGEFDAADRREEIPEAVVEHMQEFLVNVVRRDVSPLDHIVRFNGQELYVTRMCDLAAQRLALIWPEVFDYDFDMEAPMETRNRLRQQCEDTWRALQAEDRDE